jgi:hypothetical protein
MHCEVDAAFRESFLNLLSEHALRSDLREGHFLQAITRRLDDLNLDPKSPSAQERSNVVGLP